MTDGLRAIWNDLGHPRILVVGDLILDRYVRGEVERISPEAPIPVLRVTQEELRLGGAASVANNLAVLQAKVTCCGVLGDDEPGRQFRRLLVEQDIEQHALVLDGRRRTTVKTRMIAHVQHVLRVDEEDTVPVSPEVHRQLVAILEEAIPQHDIVLVSDYGKGLVTAALMERIVMLCRRVGRKVLLDPNKTGDFSPYRGVTALTPNRAESELATGIKIPRGSRPDAAAAKLMEGLDLDAVVITLDQDGIAVKQRGGELTMIPTRPRAVYDVTGAGDMVLSVLGLVLAAGGGFADAARLANVAGGLEIERVGVTPLTRKEIGEAIVGEHASPADKCKALAELVKTLDEHRRRRERIVFTNGCFDVLHIGHIKSLEAARRFGDVLVVGVNSDTSVARLKGPDRPIYNQQERAEILAALADVNYVTVFDEDTPLNLIGAIRPDVLVKGRDWQNAGVVGQEVVESYGGRVELIDLVTGVSTTDIITRVLARHGKEPGRTSAVRGQCGKE